MTTLGRNPRSSRCNRSSQRYGQADAKQSIVEVGRGAGAARFGAELPLAAHRRPLPARKPRPCAGDGGRAEGDRRAGSAFGLVFKTSFDKANRTSGAGRARRRAGGGAADLRRNPREPRPAGADRRARARQCALAAQAVDVLQIPAFLCRQTDLLVAAARTGRAVNVKKGQFLAPWDMKHVVAKLAGAGGGDVLVTERGVELRLQYAGLRHARAADPGARDRRAGDFRRHPFRAAAGRAGRLLGRPARIRAVLARAAVAVGVAGVFIETHQDPDHAPSDGPNMVPLRDFEALIAESAGVRRAWRKVAMTVAPAVTLRARVVIRSSLYVVSGFRMDDYLFSYAAPTDPPVKRRPDPARRAGDRPAEPEAALSRQPALSPAERKLLGGGGALADARRAL